MQNHAKVRFNKISAIGAVAIGVMLLFSAGSMNAFADNIQDDIVVDPPKRTITAGQSTTVNYWINANSAGSLKGCDASDGSSVTITLNVPDEVEVSPTSLTFSQCDDEKSATYSSDTPGSYEITVSAQDSNGNYNEHPAKFTLVVNAASGGSGGGEVPPDEDTTPPGITASIQGTQGSNDWYTGTVTVSWTVEENESPNSLQTSGCDETTISTDTAGIDITCEATSAGGSDSKTVTIKRDATKPEITINSDISNGQEFYFGDVPSEPTCDATDATSGVDGDGCQVSGYGTAVGSYTLKFTANDNAGNEATQEIIYTVLPWTIKGFYQPVDMNGVINVVKAGSTVPLKFEVFKGSTELTDISVRDTVTQKKVTCDTGATLDEIEQYTTTGQTTFRYDSSSGQFIDNWKSPTTKNACYQVTMTFDDGSSVSALFRTK